MLQIKNYLDAEWMDWQGMHGSQSHGLPLVKQDNFAADMLHFLPGEKTSLHTHPGNHILFVVEGGGFLNYGDEEHPLIKGSCYLVPGITPHRVSADEQGMHLLSIADTHYVVDSKERTEVVQD
jgi:quercetin dioxygenase-like cupin family protein